ncbi:10983_t:CDS:2 [Ambispora gerdemannii]|uniref:10983_t:CDS:1 n=1 Tax=Ambispora gerdemannii TaxID=144530 RepID=A0A9N8ZSS0_9GLOM|nr:10983_t:CDS:2 [Ambispora gerdemannii]
MEALLQNKNSGYHARETYLNIHARTNLAKLDPDGAVKIVNYEMNVSLGCAIYYMDVVS